MRELTAFDLVNIATKMDMITNKKHVRRVGIAKNTETARRLRKYGITTDAHLREVVVIIARELGIDDYQVVENLLCEMLRWLERQESDKLVGIDTVGVNQPLYEIEEDDVLYKKGASSREAMNFDEIRSKKGEEYSPRNQWWDPRWAPVTDNDLVLTKNSKKLKQYYEQMGNR